MNEEKKKLEQKQIQTKFIDEAKIPTFFVNVANVRAGLEEFYLTFGTISPVEVRDAEELSKIDSVDAQTHFRCVVTRNTMKQFIELMENIYNQQTQQINAFNQLQEQEGEK